MSSNHRNMIVKNHKLPPKYSVQPTLGHQQRYQQKDLPGTPTVWNMKNALVANFNMSNVNSMSQKF